MNYTLPLSEEKISVCSKESWKTRCILSVRQILRLWRPKKRLMHVPAGHIIVAVGPSHRRFVIPTSHLIHPIFTYLLAKTEEEYGFSNKGLLTIPCDESLFEEIIQSISRSDSPSTRARSGGCSHFGMKKNFRSRGESRPLLRGFADE